MSREAKRDCFCGFACSAAEKKSYEDTWPERGDFPRAVRKLLNDEVRRLRPVPVAANIVVRTK